MNPTVKQKKEIQKRNEKIERQKQIRDSYPIHSIAYNENQKIVEQLQKT